MQYLNKKKKWLYVIRKVQSLDLGFSDSGSSLFKVYPTRHWWKEKSTFFNVTTLSNSFWCTANTPTWFAILDTSPGKFGISHFHMKHFCNFMTLCYEKSRVSEGRLVHRTQFNEIESSPALLLRYALVQEINLPHGTIPIKVVSKRKYILVGVSIDVGWRKLKLPLNYTQYDS